MYLHSEVWQFYRSFSEEELKHTLIADHPGIVYSYVLERDGVVTGALTCEGCD